MRKRKSELSLLNILFCFLVIFIHTISYAVGAFPPGSFREALVILAWRLTSFVVPGFLLLAGVKLTLTGKDALPYGTYLKGRVRGILLPYVVAFCLYFLAFFLFYGYPLSPAFIAKHFVLGSLCYHLYFIPVLFQFDLLLPLWKRMLRVSPALVVPAALILSSLFESFLPNMLSTAFGISFMYNDRVFTSYLAFFVIGLYIGKLYDAFCEILRKNFTALSILFGVIFLFTGYASFLAFGAGAAVPYMNILHFVYSLYAILFLFAVSLRVPETVFEKVPLLRKIDGASYHIYLYHVLCLYAVDFLLSRLGIVAALPAFLLRFGITAVLIPALCIFYLSLKKKVTKSTSK